MGEERDFCVFLHKKTKAMRNISIILTAALFLLAVAGCNQQKGDYEYDINYLPVQLTGSAKWSILDVNTGEVVARDAFIHAPSPIVADMFYVVNDSGSYNYYNVKNPGQPVNDRPLGSATIFSEEGVALASHPGEPLSLIGKDGAVIKQLPRDIQQTSAVLRGMACYMNDKNQWGYLDSRGDIVLEARYASVNPFAPNGLAVVIDPQNQSDTASNFTVIDKQGKERFTASAQQYRPVQPLYVSGVLPVLNKDDSIVCLDGYGKEVGNPNDDHQAVDKAGWADYKRTTCGRYIVRDNKGKAGLVDCNNQSLITPKWDDLIEIKPSRYIALTDSVGQLVDEKGNAVGSARFSRVQGSAETPYAGRGFVDVNVVAGNIMILFDDQQAAGARPGMTLMDMNKLVGYDPKQYAGGNAIAVPSGPLMIEYVFDRDIATVPGDTTLASFNYDARVTMVAISANLQYTAPGTEEQITQIMSQSMGRAGFVLDHGNIFTSDNGTAVSPGYSGGVLQLLYFMHKGDAVAQPQNKRSSK